MGKPVNTQCRGHVATKLTQVGTFLHECIDADLKRYERQCSVIDKLHTHFMGIFRGYSHCFISCFTNRLDVQGHVGSDSSESSSSSQMKDTEDVNAFFQSI